MKKLLFNPQTMRKLTKTEQKNIKGGVGIGIGGEVTCGCVPEDFCPLLEVTDIIVSCPDDDELVHCCYVTADL